MEFKTVVFKVPLHIISNRFHTPGTAGGRGGQGSRVSNNVYYNADNDILYPAASVGVKRSKGKSTNKVDVSTRFVNLHHVRGKAHSCFIHCS